jgi:chromosome segregation ATPase
MTDEELVRALRDFADDGYADLSISAADRIEALTELLATTNDTLNICRAANADMAESVEGFFHERDELTEQLEAARADAKEAEAYAEELEVMNKNQEAMIRQADRRGDALEAKLAKAVELLKEARQDLEAYVTHDWPKDVHPHYDKKWERDMELCRRIDATLAEIEGEKT